MEKTNSLMIHEEYNQIDTLLLAQPKKAIKDYDEIFSNNKPVTLEIGCGRGELISHLSLIYQQYNYLGIELSQKRINNIVKKINIEHNSNVRIIKAKVDAEFLKLLPAGKLRQIIILHPDPWPKRRHHKNRLINPTFIAALAKILSDEGEVFISTDFQEYAQEIIKCFSASKEFVSLFEDGYSRVSFWENLETHFEAKKKKEGFLPYYMKYIKKLQ